MQQKAIDVTASQPDSDDSSMPSFEEALAELEAIVNKLESGDISLDDAIAAYARGTELKQQCQKRLEEAQLKVEKIKLSETGGVVAAEPFDSASS
jgi:exodeoxyribonuclease VII small subunit